MSALAYALAFVTFVLAMFGVTPWTDAIIQVLAAGFAFIALGLLLGAAPASAWRVGRK